MRTVALALAATLFLPAVAVADVPAPPEDRFFAYDRPATFGVHVARTNVPVRDGSHLIEWLARQPWTTGRVGQMGVSYGDHSSLLVAVNKPPHLAAIIPVDGISDWYENTIYRGGIYSTRIRPWQHGMAAGQYADIGTGAFWRGGTTGSLVVPHPCRPGR